MFESRPLGDIQAVLAALNEKSRSSIYRRLREDPDFPLPTRSGNKLQWFMDEIETYKVTRPRRQYADKSA